MRNAYVLIFSYGCRFVFIKEKKIFFSNFFSNRTENRIFGYPKKEFVIWFATDLVDVCGQRNCFKICVSALAKVDIIIMFTVFVALIRTFDRILLRVFSCVILGKMYIFCSSFFFMFV